MTPINGLPAHLPYPPHQSIFARPATTFGRCRPPALLSVQIDRAVDAYRTPEADIHRIRPPPPICGLYARLHVAATNSPRGRSASARAETVQGLLQPTSTLSTMPFGRSYPARRHHEGARQNHQGQLPLTTPNFQHRSLPLDWCPSLQMQRGGVEAPCPQTNLCLTRLHRGGWQGARVPGSQNRLGSTPGAPVSQRGFYSV
jgi:hypothetical protein